MHRGEHGEDEIPCDQLYEEASFSEKQKSSSALQYPWDMKIS